MESFWYWKTILTNPKFLRKTLILKNIEKTFLLFFIFLNEPNLLFILSENIICKFNRFDYPYKILF